ncbi:MAG: beta-galactosidase [Nitrospiraceae bacterium]|nr:beta-galactosidase [Nitrospiraceae bacterium]
MKFAKSFVVLLAVFLMPAVLSAASGPVSGIYSLTKGMGQVDQSVLRLDYVKGISIRAGWDEIEPEEGRFNWGYLDNALKEVKKANKKAMIRILPGVHSPAWVFKKGIRSIDIRDSNPHHKTYGILRRVPLPWDEVYLGIWLKFVEALGKRYNGNDAIVLVHMAGPTVNSAEMHIPKRGEAKTLVINAGYSKDALVSAWRRVMDAYSAAFPEKELSLNIAVPFRRDGTLEDVIQYGISKIGNRFAVQGNWLSAHTRDRFYPYHVMAGLNANVNKGFQMLAASKNGSRQGSLDVSIQKGLKAGARYFEIYEADIRDYNSRQLFEGLDKKLR